MAEARRKRTGGVRARREWEASFTMDEGTDHGVASEGPTPPAVPAVMSCRYGEMPP